MEKNMKKYSNNKAITLIALIITIIVMLILVMVSISIALNTGLFDAAGKATQKTNIAKEEEKELAEGKVNIDGTTYNSIDEYISGMGDIKPGERASDGNATYKGVTIPEGFTVSKVKGEYEDISKGLVIYDIPEEDLKDGTVDWTDPETVKPNYNQFVWIPVKVDKTTDTRTNISSFYGCSWKDSADGGERYGKSGYIEPHPDFDGEDGTGIANQIAELTESIYNYGGFFIGRYEAGSTTERTNESSQTVSCVVQQDKYPYNYVGWGWNMNDISTSGAAYLSNKLYPSNNVNYGATSMLCTGACWDAVLEFIKDSTHNVTEGPSWGNYENSETYKIFRGSYAVISYSSSSCEFSLVDKTNGTDVTKDTAILLTTGATERNSSKNIYDIAGNCLEYTTEAYENYRRVLRGGDCTQLGGDRYFTPAARIHDGYYNINMNAPEASFRPILYINE